MPDLTTKEAAALLNLSPDTVKRHCQRKVITATKHGRDWMISPEEIERFKAARRRPGRPKNTERNNEP